MCCTVALMAEKDSSQCFFFLHYIDILLWTKPFNNAVFLIFFSFLVDMNGEEKSELM
jgi:hypothetical protein